MMRVLVVALPFCRDDWRPVIWVLAVASLVVGSMLAVVQTERQADARLLVDQPRRLHPRRRRGRRPPAGEADAGRACRASLCTCCLLGARRRLVRRRRRWSPAPATGTPTSPRSAASGSASPALALALTVFLLAQAGVPFTSGFIAKFGVIQAAVDEHSYALAIIAMVAVGDRRLPLPADHGQRVDGR